MFDLELSGTADDEVLKAAAREGRLLVSHDVNTMSAAFSRLLAAEEASHGLLLIPQSLAIGSAIDDLELICRASSNGDWVGMIDYLPL